MLGRGAGANDMGANLSSVNVGAGWTVVEVAAGIEHTCARLENGAARALKCWGANWNGELGLGDTNHRGGVDGGMGDNLPAVQLGTGRSAVALVLGHYHSCALLDDASVKCWGRNYDGQLGLGDTLKRGAGANDMGDSLPAVALCPGPCPAGYTGADGGPCAACETLTYKAAAGSGTCAACPSKTGSAAGSDELSDCVCVSGYTSGSDGAVCSACEAGTYKATWGPETCVACPAYTVSSDGSNELTDCKCLPGYWAASDGVECAACDAGTFKSVVGKAACETCPANSESSFGSALCQCSTGLVRAGGVGGACIDACPATGAAVVSPCAVAPTCTVSAVHAGYGHTCALSSLGGVRCWGSNSEGQLGNAAGEVASLVDLGANRTVVQLALGDSHTCALLDNGQLKCWGKNFDYWRWEGGQLGLGDYYSRGDDPYEMGANLSSVDLGAGWTIFEVAAGYLHTCARLENGEARALKCWGGNIAGQLGLGDESSRGDGGGEMGDSLPAVQLGTGRSAVALALGGDHSCALLDDASVKCWGRNWDGLLGRGTDEWGYRAEMGDDLPAVDLGAGRTAVQLAAGRWQNCALLDDGQLKCWGGNHYGQLGLGDTLARGAGANDMGANLSSVDLGAGWTVVEVAAGTEHTCARLENGEARAIKCWGYNNFGQLGLGDTNHRGGVDGSMGDSLPAVQLGTGRWAVALALGHYHSCALLDDASVQCWGYNNDGQLGPVLGDQDGEMGHSPLCRGACPVGYAAGYTGADGWACVACLAGTYTATAGAESCAACPSHSSCAAGSDELADCTCVAGYTAASDGVACSICTAGTFKSAVGTGACETCPANSGSSSGSVLCQCWAGFTGADGGPCEACDAGQSKATAGAGSCVSCLAGTFQSAVGAKACETCPVNSESSSGSSLCQCSAGFTGADGGPCEACDAGEYKATAGAGTCAVCPENSDSAAGSDELADCTCLVGYTAASDGEPCSACTAGTFKSGVGTAECETCIANAESSSGSALCQCSAGFAGADGEPCEACNAGQYKATAGAGTCATCEAGTYKAAVGVGSCAACPSNTTSSVGSNELTDCNCLPGYTAASDGVACSICTAGTFKSVVGTAECETCPANSQSSSGSALCQCWAGYTVALDGVACEACEAGTFNIEVGSGSCSNCEAGTYKATVGSGTCTACPENSDSAAGSADCTCNSGLPFGVEGSALCQCSAGFTDYGAPELGCYACDAGTYTATVGAGSCAACPSHSTSAAGSDELTDCACDAGYTGPDGGACAACSDCDTVVTFTATVAMSRAEFSADKQVAYVAGVAQALSVVPSRVAIASITDQSTRRQLLAASIAVSTIATVPKDKAAGVATAATAENLNRALASSGISVGAISSPKIPGPVADTSTPATFAPVATGGLAVAALAGIGAGVVVLLVAAGAGAYCWVRSRRGHQEHFTVPIPTPTCWPRSRRVHQEKFPVLIPTRHVTCI
ncbi:hypothetical protein T484DRAFT_3264942 [Baffinella frigidus]|nr:hypothetical protein T484DRAFT_3264942 [Cryptophyta sp. CCMP2293]